LIEGLLMIGSLLV